MKKERLTNKVWVSKKEGRSTKRRGDDTSGESHRSIASKGRAALLETSCGGLCQKGQRHIQSRES